MNALYERDILGNAECHELFGEHRAAKKMRKQYKEEKKFESTHVNTSKESKSFEGTLVPVSWDYNDNIRESSLYPQDDEDILLDHVSGMEKFKPFINQKVKIWGEIVSNARGERRIIVNTICALFTGFSKPLIDKFDEFGNLIAPAA